MNDKKMAMIAGAIVILITVGAISFYSGMAFGQSKKTKGFGQLQGFENQQLGQSAKRMQGTGGANRGNGGMISGEIISKDDKSITIKLGQNGSKIIFYSTSTEVGKYAKAEIGELAAGQNIMVFGQTNQDGSVNAQSIQIRPEIVAGQQPKVDQAPVVPSQPAQ
ncbi:MAG: hypothetical protein WCW26_04450 [Candidatus Buchananbacteria bacterium]